MDFFIHKLCSGRTDPLTHLQFERYSRGLFKDKAVVKIKNSKRVYSISTTYEYSNEFALYLANKLGYRKTQVTGVIVSTRNLKEEDEFRQLLAHAQVKQFAGVKQFIISQEISGKEIASMISRFPRAFFTLFKTK